MKHRSVASKIQPSRSSKRVQQRNTSIQAKKPKSGQESPSSAGAPLAAAAGPPRCKWAGAFFGATSLDYIKYHDKEWGRPIYDDRLLFELLVLEGAQAGLSWSTILSRRAAYRKAFKEFDPALVAAFGESELNQLMAEGSGVVRHRGKLESAVKNAEVFLELQRQHGSFASYVWGFVPDRRPIVNSWTSVSQVPAKTPESEALSKSLKKAGMTFVGPTIMYAFMQAVGMVNDHTTDCHCYQQIIDGYSGQQQPE